MVIVKQLRKNKAFSIIEIIIALVFSSVILTTFVSLSAWGLNNAKDNEVEDTATQSMVEVNDLLRSSSDISVDTAPTILYGFYTLNYAQQNATAAERNKLIKFYTDSGIFTLDDLTLDFCRNNPSLQVKFSDASSNLITSNVICVMAKITKMHDNPLDNRYTYTIKVVAEKSGDQSYEETIDGLRVGNFIASN
ncbi:MAG: hypothetical protein WCO33_00875 [bacterium]